MCMSAYVCMYEWIVVLYKWIIYYCWLLSLFKAEKVFIYIYREREIEIERQREIKKEINKEMCMRAYVCMYEWIVVIFN